jgi:hypothetical protein
MNSKTREDLVFETTASCAVIIAAAMFAALVYQLIAIAEPFLQTIAYAGIVR